MQPSPWSEEGKQFPGLGDPSVKDFGSLDRNWENYGEGQGYLRQYNSRPFLDRKMGTADLQTPAPYYTPFTFTGGHWHRWHTRKVDQTGVAIPKEFDEREAKENDFYAESQLSKWASYIMEGSAWDDEFFFMEKTPQGYWADFFDPAWESIMRSAKIFNDEDMPEYWQNRFRAMGFYMPLVVWFSRRLMRKMWRLEKQLAMRTDGRRNEGFARRFRYGLGIKRRRKLGPKKRRRIGVLTWHRLAAGALIFLPVPFFVEQLRRDTTPFAYAVAFGVVGAMFGPRSAGAAIACATVGWFWGAGKEFVQRFEGATMTYLRDTEKLKSSYVQAKVDKIREKLHPKAVQELRLNRTAWLDEHKRDAIGHPWASVQSGHWEDPVEDPKELDLYPDYPWFRPALWRPYMWFIRPYEPVVPDPRSPYNPEDEEAFKAAHVSHAMVNIVDRESLQYWLKGREELQYAENDLPEFDEEEDDGDVQQDEWPLEGEGPGYALEMEQDEDVEPRADPEALDWEAMTDDQRMKVRDILLKDDYYWQPASDQPGWDADVFAPVDPDDHLLAEPELTDQDYANEDYDAYGPVAMRDDD